MCGIVGFRDKSGRLSASSGRIMLTMLEALACRGPDGAGLAMIGRETEADSGSDGAWFIRFAGRDEPPFDRLAHLGRLVPLPVGSRRERTGSSLRARFVPNPGVTPTVLEQALGARRGGLEILSLGRRLDLVKQVGSPSQLEAAYSIAAWTGPLAIGHTRLSTESRIDLSHSQPFWAHGVPDLATVHNGHVTNFHQLRRRYEQQGVIFYTDNDSEVIGVYLRDRMGQGAASKVRSAIQLPTWTEHSTTWSFPPRAWGSCATATASSRSCWPRRTISSRWQPKRLRCGGRYRGILSRSSRPQARCCFIR